MQIDVPSEFVEELRNLLKSVECDESDEAIKLFIAECVYSATTSFCHNLRVIGLLQNPPTTKENEPIPPGGICPQCEMKIVIGQDLKRKCNCKVWNYDP